MKLKLKKGKFQKKQKILKKVGVVTVLGTTFGKKKINFLKGLATYMRVRSKNTQELSQLYEDQKKYHIKKDEWLEKRRVLLSLLKNNKVNSKTIKNNR